MNETVGHLAAATPRPGSGELRSPLHVWPLRKQAVTQLAISFSLLLSVWSGLGLLYMWLLDDGPVGDLDRDIATWFEDHRTERLDTLAELGSGLSDTLVKVVLVALVGAVMVAMWRRWHDAVFLATLLIFEASVFAVSSLIVGRDRPPVEQLEDAAPSGSFPSGHSAAAVAFYVGLYIIFTWHTRNRLVRTVFGIIAIVAPIVVATARVYMGMHHASDVLAGILLGVASIVAVRRVMHLSVAEVRAGATGGQALPEHVTQLDLVAAGTDTADVPSLRARHEPAPSTTGSRP